MHTLHNLNQAVKSFWYLKKKKEKKKCGIDRQKLDHFYNLAWCACAKLWNYPFKNKQEKHCSDRQKQTRTLKWNLNLGWGRHKTKPNILTNVSVSSELKCKTSWETKQNEKKKIAPRVAPFEQSHLEIDQYSQPPSSSACCSSNPCSKCHICKCPFPQKWLSYTFKGNECCSQKCRIH